MSVVILNMFQSSVLFLICIVQVSSDCVPCNYTAEFKLVDCRLLPAVTTCIYDNIPSNLNSNIIELRLRNQPIKLLRNYAFTNASIIELEDLSMNFCELSAIEKDALKNLTKLEVFSAAHNNLSQLLVGTFDDNVKLEVLNISYNIIKELNNGLFDKLAKLKELYIDNNVIHYIGDKLFEYNSNLTTLKLSNNKLQYVDGNVLENLNPKLNLFIDNNHWDCTCNLWRFHNLSLKYLENVDKLPECWNKYAFRNEKWAWKQLQPADFTCEPNITIHTYSFPNSSNITLVCEVLANPAPSSINFYRIKNGITTFVPSKGYKSVNKNFTYCRLLIIETEGEFKERSYSCIANQNYKFKNIAIRKNTTSEEIKEMINNNTDDEEMKSEMMLLNSADAMKMNEIPEKRKIILGNSTEFECSSNEPSSVVWLFRGFHINEDAIKRTDNKYKVKFETNKSVLTINNISIEDQGLYECKNTLENRKYLLHATFEASPLLAIILGAIFLVLLLVFIITLCCCICRNNTENKNTSLNRTVNRNSTNEYVCNKNECMEESSIYISSDNNIYEDIIYGPAATKQPLAVG